MKKVLSIIIIIGTISFLAITLKIIEIKKENDKIDSEAVILKENLTIEFGKKAKVSDFIENLNGTLLNDFTINTEKLGVNNVNFEFLNIKNKRRTASFDIEVVDVTSPKILSGSSYTVKVGYSKSLTDELLSGDDIDDNPTRTIEGEYDFNQIGDYPLVYVVKDASGNETRAEFTLHVVEKKINIFNNKR